MADVRADALARADEKPFIDNVTDLIDEARREQPDSNALESDEPVGYDGLGAPLYAHQVSPLGEE